MKSRIFKAVLALAGVSVMLGAIPRARADILYVTLFNNTIEKITSAGSGSAFANTALNNPFGLAFDSAGNLYVANQANNTIEKYTIPR